MSGQGRARSAQASESTQRPSTGDLSRAGPERAQEGIGNSGMADRLRLLGAAQEKEPASAKLQRPAWLGEDDSGREGGPVDPVDPALFDLSRSIPNAPPHLMKAMVAFEARMRPGDEAAWRDWHKDHWRHIADDFKAMAKAPLQVHGAQSRSENRAIKEGYERNIETLLAGDALFTLADFRALEEIHKAENPENGASPTTAKAENARKGTVSPKTGRVFAPPYDSSSRQEITTLLTELEAKDIPFFEADLPTGLTADDFPAFAAQNSFVLDEKSARGALYPVAKYLKANPGISVRMTGRSHFDLTTMGIPDAGRTMGRARARTLYEMLLKMGVAPGQLVFEGEQISREDARDLGVSFEVVK